MFLSHQNELVSFPTSALTPDLYQAMLEALVCESKRHDLGFRPHGTSDDEMVLIQAIKHLMRWEKGVIQESEEPLTQEEVDALFNAYPDPAS